MDTKIPRSPDNDYTPGMAAVRRDFAAAQTGAVLDTIGSHAIDPAACSGNIEHFIGCAQVPIGLAGPLRVKGEHAQGDFYIPLATTEGTLVASYNRGMKVLTEAGGVTVTISEDIMQRSPGFIFDSARDAKAFRAWLVEHFEEIKAVADATSSVGRLRDIDPYTASKFLFLRFNYTTGDAAGQNMVSKATHAACEWIRANCPLVEHYYLESNFSTDKKHSHINTLRTRGKRVVAEASVPRELLAQRMRVTPEQLRHQRSVSMTGAFLAGASNNGPHSANAIAALFIATGQDLGNVAESSAGISFAEVLDNGDYYFSITIPALIVATHGGGTGLPTQRECLELLGCHGTGKVHKFAEIVAATVLAGDLSLACAIAAEEWVSSHEKYGRNR
jgi:hydroxymethylglutaryl-CoA reductase (NADPH)